MGTFINAADLAPFATIAATKANAMIEDAEAWAILTAPCLSSLTVAPDGETTEAAEIRTGKVAAVKAILRGAILRWNDAGSGAITQESVGPFGHSIDTRQARKSMFWPSEITELQGICSNGDSSKAFSVDVLGADTAHLPWCSLNFGAAYCSCGVDIAGVPIYEAG
jgi:hypothetical protein